MLVIGAVVLGVTALMPKAAETVDAQAAAGEGGLDTKLKNNEQRVALLESYGWKVEAEPRSAPRVQIPKTFDDTYRAYNAIQLGQGLDLTPIRETGNALYLRAARIPDRTGGGCRQPAGSAQPADRCGYQRAGSGQIRPRYYRDAGITRPNAPMRRVFT